MSPSLGCPRRGLADLLELGVRLAHSVHPTGDIPHLAEVVVRRGSSRTVTGARRLAAELRRVS